MATSATQQFAATVTNSTNTAVTWHVNGVSGGNITLGLISSAGLYTAPSSVPTPATVTVSAVSQADTSKGASASVTITAPATPTAFMSVTPSSASVPAGGQRTFGATVNGSPIAVTWTVHCQSQTAGACGSFDQATGVYTAPLSPPPGGDVSVTATANDNSVAPSGASVTVQLSNGTLNGQYAFSFTGQTAGGQYVAAGSISFDGNGNITGGIEDVNSGAVSSVTINSGTYHIGTDGRGNATLQTSAGTADWQFTVVNHTKALVVRFDSGTPGASGTMDLQDASKFTSAGFAGNYAFNLSGANASGRPGSLAAAGALTSDGAGVISSGALDVNSAGVPSPGLSLNAGTYAAPSSAGRGTLAISSAFGAQTFAYYIVDANHVKVVEADVTNRLAGDLFKQPSGPFTSAAYRGGFAFAFLGSTANGPLGEGGVLTFDGAGNVTSGTMDISNNGNPQNGLAVSGTYTVADAVTGRTTASLTVGGSTLQYVLYPQINGAMSVVEIDTTNTVAGRALQQSGSFSGGTLSGNYALNLTGTDLTVNPGQEDIVGRAVPNGGSALTGLLDINDNGVTARAAALSGSYLVSSSGRGSATLNTGSSAFSTGTFNFYIADSGDIFFLESDSNRVLVGTMQKQF